MKVHLSVDDVIYSLMEAAEKKPSSIFDIAFFGMLKGFCEQYGAVFSLYAFENYSETFKVNQVPTVYWDELSATGCIKIGFHGTFFMKDATTFLEKAQNFYASVPENIWANVIRLHEYSACEEKIEGLKKFGLSDLLCRDWTNSIAEEFPCSYILTKKEENTLEEGYLEKQGITFRKTNIRLEFFDSEQLKQKIREEIKTKEELIIFTHEKELMKNPWLLECTLDTLSEYKVQYI